MDNELVAAKAFLSQAFRLDQRINSNLEQVQRHRELLTKTTSVLVDMPKADSPDLQPVASIVAKLVDLENEVNEDIDELVDLKRAITHAVKRIPADEQRLVLELRYLCYHTWEKIAVELDISLMHVHRIHAQALKTFSEGGYEM